MRRLSEPAIDRSERWQPAEMPARQGPARTAPLPRRQRLRLRHPLPGFSRRMLKAGIALVALGVLAAGPAWLVFSASGRHLWEEARARAMDLSVQAGFRVAEIFVEGRTRTPRDELLAALQIRRDDPILGLDLKEVRQRLEEISWVKTATLERRLPDEIHIVITEREPVALWQNQGRYYLIDRTGLVVGGETRDQPGLPLIVGEGAPDHASALLDLLSQEPAIAARVKAAQWVSERRWNLTLAGGEGVVQVRLPEENPEIALQELGQLDREQKLLERAVSVIDLRQPDRLILRRAGDTSVDLPHIGRQQRAPRALPGRDT